MHSAAAYLVGSLGSVEQTRWQCEPAKPPRATSHLATAWQIRTPPNVHSPLGSSSLRCGTQCLSVLALTVPLVNRSSLLAARPSALQQSLKNMAADQVAVVAAQLPFKKTPPFDCCRRPRREATCCQNAGVLRSRWSRICLHDRSAITRVHFHCQARASQAFLLLMAGGIFLMVVPRGPYAWRWPRTPNYGSCALRSGTRVPKTDVPSPISGWGWPARAKR